MIKEWEQRETMNSMRRMIEAFEARERGEVHTTTYMINTSEKTKGKGRGYKGQRSSDAWYQSSSAWQQSTRGKQMASCEAHKASSTNRKMGCDDHFNNLEKE